MRSLRILLDTSSISRLARQPPLASRFVHRAHKTGVTCYLPMLGLIEFCDGAPERRDARVDGLGRLVRQLPPSSVRIASAHQDLIRAELEEPITALPVDAQEKANLKVIRGWSKADKTRFDLWIDPARLERLHQDRDFYLERDRQAAGWIKEKADPSLLPDVKCCGVAGRVLEMTALLPELKGGVPVPWLQPEPPMDPIWALPQRYPAFTIFAHLVLRHMFANMIPADEVCPKHTNLFDWFRSKETGNWHDNLIHTLGAYADLVLTNDSDFVRRGEYLRNLGVPICQTQFLGDFLDR